jgi:hypothetical protein
MRKEHCMSGKVLLERTGWTIEAMLSACSRQVPHVSWPLAVSPVQ